MKNEMEMGGRINIFESSLDMKVLVSSLFFQYEQEISCSRRKIKKRDEDDDYDEEEESSEQLRCEWILLLNMCFSL